MGDFDLPGLLRRVRRRADLSQRDLAAGCGISQSAIAQAQSGRRDLGAACLARAAELAGLRLTVLDSDGREVRGMSDAAVRDKVGRQFPAHLDTRYSDEGWWHGESRYSRQRVWYTFDRDRYYRDRARRRGGMPDDHLLPRADDSPEARKAQRQMEIRRRAEEALERRRRDGELDQAPLFTCSCPPECDALDDWSGKPVHADECLCRCDVG